MATVGHWLNSEAKTIYTYLTGENNPRERMLFSHKVPSTKFVTLHILNILNLFPEKGAYGFEIRLKLTMAMGNKWDPNNTVYTILNSMEKDGYVTSTWRRDEDSNKRHKRIYRITDEGKNQLNILKQQLYSRIKDMISIIDTAVKLIYNGDYSRLEETSRPILISSVLFTDLQCLNYLNMRSPSYGNEIRLELKRLHQNKWNPSYGTLYPRLSKFEELDLVESYWDHSDPDDLQKKRTIRIYKITDKGKRYLKWLKDICKNRILDVKIIMEETLNLVYGESTVAITKLKGME